MKYRYFGNVLAHIEFEVEAPDEETADEKAMERLDRAKWHEFRDVGSELGRYTNRGWDEVLRSGDLS